MQIPIRNTALSEGRPAPEQSPVVHLAEKTNWKGTRLSCASDM